MGFIHHKSPHALRDKDVVLVLLASLTLLTFLMVMGTLVLRDVAERDSVYWNLVDSLGRAIDSIPYTSDEIIALTALLFVGAYILAHFWERRKGTLYSRFGFQAQAAAFDAIGNALTLKKIDQDMVSIPYEDIAYIFAGSVRQMEDSAMMRHCPNVLSHYRNLGAFLRMLLWARGMCVIVAKDGEIVFTVPDFGGRTMRFSNVAVIQASTSYIKAPIEGISSAS